MARKDDNILGTVISAMTEAVRELRNRNAGNTGQDALGRFLECSPSTFNGRHDRDKAHLWIQQLEKLFEELQSPDNQRNVGPQRNNKKGLYNKEKPYSRPSDYSNQTGKNHNPGSPFGGALKVGSGNGNRPRCGKCGKKGHLATDCWNKDFLCFRCGKPGHISTNCNEVKKGQADSSNSQANSSEAKGEVYTLNEAKTAQQEDLTQGTPVLTPKACLNRLISIKDLQNFEDGIFSKRVILGLLRSLSLKWLTLR